jgi:sigma54-dependent transcription regulator
MNDEAKLLEDASRAVGAQHALDTVGHVLAALKAEYLKAWEGTGAKDTDARERLWQAFQIVGKVESNLKTMVANGKLSERALAEIKKFGDPRKARGQV